MFIDNAHIKAHQNSGSNENQQAINKSVVGQDSKIHLAAGADGNPINFTVIDATTNNNVKVAPDLINEMALSNTVVVCTDKVFDLEDLRAHIQQTNTDSNISIRDDSETGINHIE